MISVPIKSEDIRSSCTKVLLIVTLSLGHLNTQIYYGNQLANCMDIIRVVTEGSRVIQCCTKITLLRNHVHGTCMCTGVKQVQLAIVLFSLIF